MIHDPNARPETVEKALSRKTDVIFRQAHDKLADVQRENADLRTQNAALAELAPEGAEGARAKAEKYDKLKPEFDALKQTNEQHEKILLNTFSDRSTYHSRQWPHRHNSSARPSRITASSRSWAVAGWAWSTKLKT